jgi:hypothetical protein
VYVAPIFVLFRMFVIGQVFYLRLWNLPGFLFSKIRHATHLGAFECACTPVDISPLRITYAMISDCFKGMEKNC